MRHDQQHGFTLLELMIVIAIIGILATIALPAYQTHMRHANIFEGINLATASKTAVYQHYYMTGAWPADNSAAGLAPSTTITGHAVKSIEVLNGIIKITYNEKVDNDKTVLLTPSIDSTGSMQWDCTGGDMPSIYRPSNCQP